MDMLMLVHTSSVRINVAMVVKQHMVYERKRKLGE